MALTSSTGEVTGNEVLFQIMVKGDAKGMGVISYIDYVKGGSDTLTMKIKYNESTLTEDFYYDSLVDVTDLTITEMGIASGGKYRFPLPISYNEDQVIVEFNGLVDGDINVEFSIDNPYR